MKREITTRPDKTINDGKLYQKIGKRYHPVSDIHALDGLHQGAWLVLVDSGCTSIRRCIEPDNASVEVAFKITEDKLVNIIAKASEARPKSTPLTPREQKAIKAYYKVMQEEKILMFNYQSMHGIAQEILAAVKPNQNEKVY